MLYRARYEIFVDEHIPLMTVQALRMMGHDVCDIRGTPDQGMQDDALWQMAQWEGRLLITTDKGFPQYHAVPYHRVFIIRLRRPNRHKIHQRIMQALRQFSDAEWSDLLVVMRDVAQSTWRVRESH
jgi:predicted nuclease of predicted toxin-antitoxin system